MHYVITNKERLAVHWLKLAATNIHAESQYTLGLYYDLLHDNGPCDDRNKDRQRDRCKPCIIKQTQAVGWLIRAATSGHPFAQARVGYYYQCVGEEDLSKKGEIRERNYLDRLHHKVAQKANIDWEWRIYKE